MENNFVEELQEASGTPFLKEGEVRISCRDIDLFYGEECVLHKVSLDIGSRGVLAVIGPSRSGKSSFLRCLNRMNDTVEDCTMRGKIHYDGEDIYHLQTDVIALRTKVGMIFKKPTPFPKSIYDNVAYGARIHGIAESHTELDSLVEDALQQAGLWDEVKDRIDSAAMALSSSQQQRLCIARALAINPEVLLLDDPCSGLDPIATAKIETLVEELRERHTIIFVSNSLQQAARVSQRTAFFRQGHLIEVSDTQRLFTMPENPLTEEYLTGRTRES